MSFVDFARAHGVEIDPSRLYPSEKIKRCGTTDKPSGTAGAYFWDGERGWVFNWSQEAKVQWFEDKNAKPWTDAEKAAWKAKRQAGQVNQEREYLKAAERASVMLREATPGEHSYLTIKGFKDAQGLVSKDGVLLIPMRNLLTNALQGVQMIQWIEADRKYQKKMNPGMKAKGAIFRMGDKTAPETFLVEGYATGLSVLAALRSVGLRASVLVCFSAGNMVHIAPQVKRGFVFADNDASGTGQKSAEQTNMPWCMADEAGMDANDLHMKRGLMAVCQKLMEVRRMNLMAA